MASPDEVGDSECLPTMSCNQGYGTPVTPNPRPTSSGARLPAWL